MYFQHLTASVGTGMYNISVTVLKKLFKPISNSHYNAKHKLKKKNDQTLETGKSSQTSFS